MRIFREHVSLGVAGLNCTFHFFTVSLSLYILSHSVRWLVKLQLKLDYITSVERKLGNILNESSLTFFF